MTESFNFKKPLNIILPIFLLFLLNKEANSQKLDYMDIRDSLTSLTCGEQNMESVNSVILKLEAFDTNSLSRNIHHYYYDLGMAYYTHYGITMDTISAGKSIQAFKKALHHKPKHSPSLWNIALLYFFLKDCPKSKFYLNKHKKATPKKHWDKEQFKSIEKRCG